MSSPLFCAYFLFTLLVFPVLLGSNRPPWALLVITVVTVIVWLSGHRQSNLQVPPMRSKGVALVALGLLLPVVWGVVQAMPLWGGADGACARLFPPSSPMMFDRMTSGCALSLDPWSSLQIASLYGAYYLAFVAGFRMRIGRRRAGYLLSLIAGYLVVAIAIPPLLAAAGPEGISGTFVNPNHFATFALLLLSLAGYAWHVQSHMSALGHEQSGWARALPAVAVPLAIIAVLMSDSRSALFGLLVGMMALYPYMRSRRKSNRLSVPLILVAGMGVVGLAVLGIGGFGTLVKQGLESTRYQMWATSLPMLHEYPLAGIGTGAFAYVYPRYKVFGSEMTVIDHPHSELLELFIEQGVIVPVIAISLVLLGIGKLARSAQLSSADSRATRPATWILLAGLLAFLIVAMLDFPSRIPAVGMLAYTILGLAVQRLAGVKFSSNGK